MGRAYYSQMKVYEQLVAGVLAQVLDDIEDERVKQGQKRLVLLVTNHSHLFMTLFFFPKKEGDQASVSRI